jgi:ABC-type multidrug transport system fused ATPase/permease subunit
MLCLFLSSFQAVSEVYVSTRRIQEFLELPELPKVAISSLVHVDLNSPLLSLDDVTCHWNFMSRDKGDADLVIALDSISVEFHAKALYGIMGIVGSGKSALLQALVGELPVSHGKLHREQVSMAYASQDPWIMNGTLKENVLMGLPHREDWYQQVIHACALLDDIRQFAHGDDTLLGDKGVQCSGGQRARIGLARAIYRDTQIWVLDDPMSAVDTKVGRWIYQQVIHGLGLKRGKCVILATHQLHFLENATRCLLMENGKIACQGSYNECIHAAHGAALSSPAELVDSGNIGDTSKAQDIGVEVHDKTTTIEPAEKTSTTRPEHKEERNTGIMKLSTWIHYANAMGGLRVAVVLFAIFSVAQGLSLVSQVAIGRWSEQPAEEQRSANSLCIVLGLTVLTVFIAVDRALLAFYFFNKASQRLHDRMTKSVLFSRISFMDTNPSGRLINRFSADVGIADEQLPLSLYDCLVGLYMALGSLAVAVAVLPVILVAVPPLVWYLMSMRRIFVSTSCELKRLEGLGRSPIFEMLGEALHGISTIRSNQASVIFLRRFESIHDAHTRAVCAFVAASRWFATRLEFVTFMLMAVSTIAAATLYDQGKLAYHMTAYRFSGSLISPLFARMVRHRPCRTGPGIDSFATARWDQFPLDR